MAVDRLATVYGFCGIARSRAGWGNVAWDRREEFANRIDGALPKEGKREREAGDLGTRNISGD